MGTTQHGSEGTPAPIGKPITARDSLSQPGIGAPKLTGTDGLDAPFLLSWRLLAWIAALAAIFIGGTFSLYRLDDTVWRAAGPQEGYYWSVAQYQIAFYRTRELVRAEAHGEPIRADEILQQAQTLETKGRVLIDPSELSAFFKALEGHDALFGALERFQSKAVGTLRSGGFARESASALLQDFDQMDGLLVKLADEVRVEEIRHREATMSGLLQRRMLLWILLGAGWVLLLAWLVTLAKSERRYRRAASEQAIAQLSEMQALKALEDAVKAKSTFLGMVSHELRSPLQDILSSLEVLERRATGENAAFVARVRRSANALKAQLQDLLTLATGEAGRLEIRPETFEAGDLVAGIIDMFTDDAARKGLQLQAHTPEGPVFAVADAKRIIQVLTNLVSNAIKYTDSGRVDVTLLPFDEDASELVFVVSDTGKGIAPEYLPSLFSAYTRFGSLEHGGREGAGIGLAIVSTVLQHLGGRIKPESKVGEGTTFSVWVPAIKPTYEDEQREGQGSDANNLLFVDDRPEVLDALASVATELGYACDKAPSAAIGANLLASRKYDVVFIDLDMPVKGGLELASETRRGNGPNAETRLVAISAADGRGIGTNWPFNAFLEKPIDRRALSDAISPRMPG